MFKRRAIIEHLRQMRGYIAFSVVLFVAGMFVGATNQGFSDFLDSQLQGIGELADSIDQSDNPALMMFIVIFINNAVKSIFIIYLGALFGVLPFLFLTVNGMVIGYLLQNVMNEHGGAYMLELVIKGLLPHGIIEIPAIIVASAYGLRFGALIWKGAGSILFSRAKLPIVGKDIEFFVRRSIPMVVLLTFSLLVASVIESTFTVWLLSM